VIQFLFCSGTKEEKYLKRRS